jgi:hypothetical protein
MKKEYISRKGKNGWVIIRNPHTQYETAVRVVNTRDEARAYCNARNK